MQHLIESLHCEAKAADYFRGKLSIGSDRSVRDCDRPGLGVKFRGSSRRFGRSGAIA